MKICDLTTRRLTNKFSVNIIAFILLALTSICSDTHIVYNTGEVGGNGEMFTCK